MRQAIDNSEKAVSLVQTAEGALNEIQNLLVSIRGLALDSANSGVNDEDALAANQAEIANVLDTIDRIANNTQFGTKKLLDGSAGINGVVSDSDVTFLRATSDTSEGTHSVEVTTAGERATLTAGTAQGTATLSANETLTINGVNVTLESGSTHAQVVDRINEFTAQTGVTAEDVSGSTRLYSTQFGSAAEISVISNLDPHRGTPVDSTTRLILIRERSIVVEFAGTAFTGTGNVVTANAGPTKGLSVSIAEDTSDATLTNTGALGTVTITDNSMVFQIGPNQNQTVEIAVTKANPGSLGLGVSENQFANLSQIDVTSASRAQDSLAIIDSGIDDITNLRGTLGAFQKNTLEAGTNNLRATLENTVNADRLSETRISRKKSPSSPSNKFLHRLALPCCRVPTKRRSWFCRYLVNDNRSATALRALLSVTARRQSAGLSPAGFV